MFVSQEFKRIQALTDAPFTIDACCNDDGSNAHCALFCSPSNSALAYNFCGHHSWWNPPYSPANQVAQFLQHYLQCKDKDPANTSACFALPDWDRPDWQQYLRNMRVIHEYPKGYHLFTRPEPDNPAKRRRLPGIPWPVKVYYDAPRAIADTLAAASTVERPTMLFQTELSGISALCLVDSGAADTAFISADFCIQNGIGYTPYRKCKHSVLLADGSTAGILGECKVQVKIGAYCATVVAKVVGMVCHFNFILGDAWLRAHKAVIDYGSESLRICKGRRTITLSVYKPPVQECTNRKHKPLESTIISNIQLKRERKKGATIFMALVNKKEEDPPQPPPPGIQKMLDALIQKHSQHFVEELPVLNPTPSKDAQRAIVQETNARPTYRGLFRYSQAELREIEARVKWLLEKGLIQPSSSPYGAPVLFARKKDGSLRMCVDYRMLNKQTVRNSYSLPRIDDLLDKLQGAKYFSSLDMMDAYHQIPLHPDDIPATAFNTPFGHYEFRVLAFGLANAPAVFQSEMNKLFRDCGKFVVVYLDDICVFSKTAEEHIKHLDTVLSILGRAGKYLKLKKCHFLRKELEFLGHIVDAHGVRPDPKKVEAVESWPTPRCVKDVRQFLGLANYFRRFIQGYAKLAFPLHQLTRNDAKWQWRADVEEKAFQDIKHALTSAPVLALPQFHKPFEVIVDASNVAMGGVLLQEGRPVAFESCKFTSAEMNYTVTEREMLAVVHCCKIWRCYLEGSKHLTVFTDHVSNTYFSNQTMLSQRQARWAEFLGRFDMSIKYKPGSQNMADPLSRHPHFLISCLSVVQTEGTLARADASQPISGGIAFKPFLERVQAATRNDPWFKNAHNITSNQLTSLRGVYYKGKQLVIPAGDDLRTFVMQRMHNDPYAGHPGRDRTIHAVRRLFWWPTLAKDVTAYVSQCHSCQMNKSSSRTYSGKLMPLPIPEGAWDTVTLDFVTDLPLTAKNHNGVMVVVDYLTKMVRLIPITPNFTAESVAEAFVNNIFSLHGLPRKLITDRDTRFTKLFWQALQSRLFEQHAKSTAYHPETDGNTERVNRLMQDIIRHYVAANQDNWDQYLGLCEFAINSGYHDSIQSTPFVLNFGRNPKSPMEVLTSLRKDPDEDEPEPNKKTKKSKKDDKKKTAREYSSMPAAVKFVEHMQHTLEHAKFCLQAAQSRQKAYADKHRADAPPYKVGDLVALKTTNIKFKFGCSKLLPKFVGPFKITQVINPVAFRLELPPSMAKLHDVFHSSLLKPYNAGDGSRPIPPPPDLIDGEEEYEVEAILGHEDRRVGNQYKRYYLVRWAGYSQEHDSWEPVSLLRNSAELVSDYLRDKNVPAEPVKPPPKPKGAPKKSAQQPAVPTSDAVPAPQAAAPAPSVTTRSMSRRANQTLAACLCRCFTRFPRPPSLVQPGAVHAPAEPA